MKEAPLFTQAFTFFNWLVNHMENQPPGHLFIKQITLETARSLIESLTLALQGFDSPERARQADEAIALLRLHVRLAEENGLLDERRYKYAVTNLDELGRQLGGWLKRLNAL